MTIDRPNKRAAHPLADWIDARAQTYATRATGFEMSAEVERFRHYAQALSMIADEIRAGMHEETPAP